MIGDFLRELAVLLFAFYILDDVLKGSFAWWGILTAAIVSGAFLWWGIILEGRDDPWIR
jgi:hypothetical protein